MSDKVFKTYKEQIELLTKERGLQIPHPRFFTNCMQKDDYYNIINGYKKYFIAGMNPERYIQGVTFEQLYALYTFDQNIRSELLTELINIEKHIKSLISYHFSEVHGHDHRLYLDPNCFKNDSTRNRQFTLRIISKLEHTINYYTRIGTNSICHYVNEYGYVPLWVLNGVTTMGQVSKFYSCMKLAEQTAVARHFKISPNQMSGFIKFLTDIRNTCAHGSRIYTSNKAAVHQILIPDTRVHTELEIPRNNAGNYIYGKSDFLAILIMLKYLSAKKDFGIIKKHLKKYYDRMAVQIPDTILANIHLEMGLPMNYLYKL